MPKDPDILIDLTTASSAFEAEVIANALEAHGVPARAFAGAGHVSHHEVAASQPYRVQVRRRDLEHARTLLDEIRKEHAAIDWDSVDVGEMEDAQETAPQGSVNPPGRPTPAAGLSGPRARSSLVGAPAPRPVQTDRDHQRASNRGCGLPVLVLAVLFVHVIALTVTRTTL